MNCLRPLLAGLLLTVGIVACLVMVVLERHLDRHADNFALIEHGLYMGGDVKIPPPGTRAVLNLCEAKDPYQCMIHRWESILDCAPAPDLDWLKGMVEFVDDQRRAGRTTFVHCRNGVSRSGLIVTAYIMFKKKMTRDEALAYIRHKRPEARPNVAFMERLLEWERELKK